MAIGLAATVPYLPTLDDYFVRDDFGVVQLLAAKPASSFPRWFVTSWMDDIWGSVPDEVRPFPALSYQITALGGADSPVAHHLLNIALHAGNGLLVFAIARWVAASSLAAATFAGLVFVLLPVHTEGVAWITGRVDSMPTLFYLASFLAYAVWRQRASSSPQLYIGALVLFFVALFTKQNTITMVATIAAYDLVLRRDLSWRSVGAWIPFGLLTAGYLWLRLVLFGEVAREGRLSAAEAQTFAELVIRHFTHVVTGRPDGASWAIWLALAGFAGASLLAVQPAAAPRRLAALLYFGPIWWGIGVAPIAVAGYASPRHVYLAAVGWAMVLGIVGEMLLTVRGGRFWRRSVAVLSCAVLVVYAARLWESVGEWNRIASVSRAAVRDIRTEALAGPPGSLLLAGVPKRSWEWALPFAVRPPFTDTDLTSRVFIVSPRDLHCCRLPWFEDTRRTIGAWTAAAAPGPVIALRWDDETGALSRATEAEMPALPVIARALLDVADAETLDATLKRLLNQVGNPPPKPAGGTR